MRDTIKIEDAFDLLERGIFVTFGTDEEERDCIQTLPEVELIFPDGSTRHSQILSYSDVGPYNFKTASGVRNAAVRLAGINSVDDIPYNTHLRFC